MYSTLNDLSSGVNYQKSFGINWLLSIVPFMMCIVFGVPMWHLTERIMKGKNLDLGDVFLLISGIIQIVIFISIFIGKDIGFGVLILCIMPAIVSIVLVMFVTSYDVSMMACLILEVLLFVYVLF